MLTLYLSKKTWKLYIEMSNFQEVLIKRRSIRRFTEELLLPEETENIESRITFSYI